MSFVYIINTVPVMATFSDISTDPYNEVDHAIPMVQDMPQIPEPPTFDAFDLYAMLRRGEPVPCTHCADPCLIKPCIMENNNPCHPPGASVSYGIPFCGSECRKNFIHRCIRSTPFPVDKDVVFRFSAGSDGPEDGFWTMFSLIPEGGKWVICQCTDEGELLLDDRERPIWMLVSDTVLRGAVRVYI
jgi:hypothetical protein